MSSKSSRLAFFLVFLAAASAAFPAVLALTWSDNSDNEAGFRVERALAPADGSAPVFVEIATTAANVATYRDEDLEPATRYIYRVRAFNAAGYSSYSNEAAALTLPDIPAAPGSLAVPDEPPVVTIRSDVKIEGNLIVAGTITSTAPTP